MNTPSSPRSVERAPVNGPSGFEREVSIYGAASAVNVAMSWSGGSSEQYRTVSIVTFPKLPGTRQFQRQGPTVWQHKPQRTALWDLLACALGLRHEYVNERPGSYTRLIRQEAGFQLLTTRKGQPPRSNRIEPAEMARVSALVIEAIQANDNIAQGVILQFLKGVYGEHG